MQRIPASFKCCVYTLDSTSCVRLSKKLSLTPPTCLHQQHKRSINKHTQDKSAVSGTLAQTGRYCSGKHEGVERPQSYRPGWWSRGFVPFCASREGENQTLVEATGRSCSSSSPRHPAKVLLLSEAFIHFKGPKRLTVSVGEAGEGAGELSSAALNLQLLFISSPPFLCSL